MERRSDYGNPWPLFPGQCLQSNCGNRQGRGIQLPDQLFRLSGAEGSERGHGGGQWEKTPVYSAGRAGMDAQRGKGPFYKAEGSHSEIWGAEGSGSSGTGFKAGIKLDFHTSGKDNGWAGSYLQGIRGKKADRWFQLYFLKGWSGRLYWL